MGKLLLLKPIINKKTKQVHLSLRKRDLPSNLLRALKKEPRVKIIKMKLQGFE